MCSDSVSRIWHVFFRGMRARRATLPSVCLLAGDDGATCLLRSCGAVHVFPMKAGIGPGVGWKADGPGAMKEGDGRGWTSHGHAGVEHEEGVGLSVAVG